MFYINKNLLLYYLFLFAMNLSLYFLTLNIFLMWFSNIISKTTFKLYAIYILYTPNDIIKLI